MSDTNNEIDALGLEAAWVSEDVAKVIRRAGNEKKFESFSAKNRKPETAVSPFIEVQEDFHEPEI